jgi:hypothetical protein
MNYLPKCFSIYCNYNFTLEEEEEDIEEEPRNSCWRISHLYKKYAC